MAKIAVLFHSGYGHTRKQAEAVLGGAAGVAGAEASLIAIDADGQITEADWASLQAADAIIFGAPTYMGGPSWQFKRFADASSKAWFSQQWNDKIAGGFTNSASMNGDKGSTLAYFVTLASQHGMVWVSLGMLPSNQKASGRNDVNFLGGSIGVLATSPSDSSPDEGPLPGDLETARLYGVRLAEYAVKTRG